MAIASAMIASESCIKNNIKFQFKLTKAITIMRIGTIMQLGGKTQTFVFMISAPLVA